MSEIRSVMERIRRSRARRRRRCDTNRRRQNIPRLRRVGVTEEQVWAPAENSALVVNADLDARKRVAISGESLAFVFVEGAAGNRGVFRASVAPHDFDTEVGQSSGEKAAVPASHLVRPPACGVNVQR